MSGPSPYVGDVLRSFAFVENRVRLVGEERVETAPATIAPESARNIAAVTPPERAPSMGNRIVGWGKRLFGR